MLNDPGASECLLLFPAKLSRSECSHSLPRPPLQPGLLLQAARLERVLLLLRHVG